MGMVNSCLRQLGREPVGLPHHCRAANDVRVINILPIRQQEKFLNDRCPETWNPSARADGGSAAAQSAP
jgi:hypothetical protein